MTKATSFVLPRKKKQKTKRHLQAAACPNVAASTIIILILFAQQRARSTAPTRRFHSTKPPPHPAAHILYLLGPEPSDGLLPSNTVTIPSSTLYDSASIPLRSLSSPSQPREEPSAALLTEKKKVNRLSSDSAGSDFSLWSDTGDLAEQLANEEDPLRIRLRGSFDDPGFGRSHTSPLYRRPKHVHYSPRTQLSHKTTKPGLSKEAIEIPNPPARQIGRTEKVLAIIMTGDRQRSRTHGLTGKPLLYVS